FKGRLIQIEQREADEGVIVEEPVDGRLAFAMTAQQDFARVVPQVTAQEIYSVAGGLGITRFGQDLRAFSEGRNHQSIPRRQDLVVAQWTRPGRANLKQS